MRFRAVRRYGPAPPGRRAPPPRRALPGRGVDTIGPVTRTPFLSLGRRVAAATVAVAAILTVSACGSMTSGAAAVVDGHRISVAELQTASAELATISSKEPGVPQTWVLQHLILGRFAIPLAAENHVGMSRDETRRWLAQKDGNERVPAPSAGTVDALRGALALNGLASLATAGSTAQVQAAFEQLVGQVKAADLEVNPRYGQLRLDKLEPTSLFAAVVQGQGAPLPLVESAPDWLVATSDS